MNAGMHSRRWYLVRPKINLELPGISTRSGLTKNDQELARLIKARNHARDKVMNKNTRSAKATLRKHSNI